MISLLRRGGLEHWVVQAWYGALERSRCQRWWVTVLMPLAWCVAAVARRRRQRAVRHMLGRPLVDGLLLPPVVVVGNLTVGGTGKTPVVAWLARQLLARGQRVGLVSRGHGRASLKVRRVLPGDSVTTVGDEPAWLAAQTGCPVVVGRDRLAAAAALIGEVSVVLSDDGLQHWRLPRRLEIVVVDATRSPLLGTGRCVPAGPLRELPDFIGPGQIVLFNHGAAISGEGAVVGVAAAAAAFSVPDWARRATVLHCAVQPRLAVNLRSGERRPLAAFTAAAGFSGAHVVAGIGHPERFFAGLRAAGVMLASVRALPDHHAFTAEDFSGLEGTVLMTDKDAVKCAGFAGPDWWRVEAELQFAAGAGEQLLQAVLAVVG